MAIFVVFAHIPCYFTGVMWWVDLAWPVGLVAIGAYHLMLSGALTMAAKLVCVCYIFQGARMTLGATIIITSGRWTTDRELQRYQY